MTTTRFDGAAVDVTAVDVTAPGRSIALPRFPSLGRVAARALVAVPAYPVLFMISFLLQKVGESWSPLQVVSRPFLVMVLVVVAIQLLIGRFAGRHVAAWFVSLFFLLLIDPVVADLVVLVTIIPVAWRWMQARRVQAAAWPSFTPPLNLVSIGTLAVTLFAGTTGGWFFVVRPTSAPAAIGTAPADAPDIYLVLLDGYPRSDELQREVGLDNGPFLTTMQDLGFALADRSHSNYGRTALTLSSMFHAREVTELLPNPPSDVAGQARALSKLINDGSQLDLARSRGYEIVSIPSPVDYVTLFSADRVLTSPFTSEFELTLTEQDLIRRIGTDARHWFFIDEHRKRILDTFQTLAELPAEQSARPRLVFAHVLSPHAPIAFGADGSEVMLPGCEWTLCGQPLPLPKQFVSDYAAQITYLDSLVEATAKQMLAWAVRPSVIIFFSDHGSRLMGTQDSTFDNLMLSYTPGQPGLLPRDATPINLLPRLLNAYAGTNEPLAREVRYVNPNGSFFPLQSVTP